MIQACTTAVVAGADLGAAGAVAGVDLGAAGVEWVAGADMAAMAAGVEAGVDLGAAMAVVGADLGEDGQPLLTLPKASKITISSSPLND